MIAAVDLSRRPPSRGKVGGAIASVLACLALACTGDTQDAGASSGASRSSSPPPELADWPVPPDRSVDVVEAFHPDGKPLLRREVLRDGDGMVNHGRFQRWHPNGGLAEEGWYLEGKKHGTYLIVADTGLKQSEVTYDHGRRQGPALAWGGLGELKERATYVDDRLDGQYESFVAERRLARGRYVAGREEGPWTYWYAGQGKQEEGAYRGGLRVGTWHAWYPGGVLRSEETFVEGVLDGPAVEYDEQGRKLAERSYAGGVPAGLQVEYHPDGTPESEARFSAGRLEGLQRRWYPDGTLQVEGEMRDGKREGRWTYFNVDGSVNEAWSGEYRQDERVAG